MKIRIKIFAFIALISAGFVFSGMLYAQITGQGCARVVPHKMVGNDTVEFTVDELNNGIQLTCANPSVTLLAEPFAPGEPEPASGYYRYERIPYAPPTAFNAGTEIFLPRDDCWSIIFGFNAYYVGDTIPFTFRFYNETYSNLVANSNGGLQFYGPGNPVQNHYTDIGFNNPIRGGNETSAYCPYSTSSPLPNGNFLPTIASINGPFQDIYFSSSSYPNAHMYINFVGEYPCRMCILSFYQVPMYGNTSELNTSMIVLYETSNVIEFYIENKPEYTSTNSSNAILGIQSPQMEDPNTGANTYFATTITNNRYDPDNTGTYTTKSYNNTKWKANHEAWRILPTGQLSRSVQWYKRTTQGNDAQVRQGPLAMSGENKVIAAPTPDEGPTWYICNMTATRLEDGREIQSWDSILVKPADVPSVVISHNSATNEINNATNADSLAKTDTICAGERVRFGFDLQDPTEQYTYNVTFISPANLNGQSTANSFIDVDQSAGDEPSTLYSFQIDLYKQGTLMCTRYDSVMIYKRTFTTSLEGETSICSGDTIHYFDNRDTTISDPCTYSYQWSYGNSGVLSQEKTFVYVPTTTGQVKLHTIDNFGCTFDETKNVKVNDFPILSIDGNRDICRGNSTTLKVNSSVQTVSYLWDNEDSSKTSSITVSPSAQTTYTVVVTNTEAECVNEASVTINVVKIPEIACADDARICVGQSAPVYVSGSAERYLWQSADEAVNGQTGTSYEVSPENSTQYIATAYNNDTLNCQQSDTMTIFVSQNPTINMHYSPSAIDELTPQIRFADRTQGVATREWYINGEFISDADTFMHDFVIADSINGYRVTLVGSTQEGCKDSSSVYLNVERQHGVYAPTGVYVHDVNPLNRTFNVHIDNLLEYRLRIYDRWGKLMFETTDPNTGWDCTDGDGFAQQGVYAWMAVYRHRDNPDREMTASGTFMIYN